MKHVLLCMLITSAIALITACSSPNPVSPSNNNPSFEEGIHQDWGSYTLKIDPATMEAEVVYDKTSSIHYEVTTYLYPPACGGNGCVTAMLDQWNPSEYVATYKVTIKNPTALNVSDVRMVFYNLGGKEIRNADSYTHIMTGNVNPFIAFSKGDPYRRFYGGSTSTETVKLYMPPGSSYFIFFRVSAWLWIYCNDPYEINNITQTGDLYQTGGNAVIGCDVLDWQNDVDEVLVDMTPIMGAVISLNQVNLTRWEATVTNSMGAPAGEYKQLITAKSASKAPVPWLYNWLLIRIKSLSWELEDDWILPAGPCTLDFGIDSSVYGGSPITVSTDLLGQCAHVRRYPGGWSHASYVYRGLDAIDAAIPAFQPFPVVRIDSTSNGSFCWTNSNDIAWSPTILNLNTSCSVNEHRDFILVPEANNHRHVLIHEDIPLIPIECCDTFDDDHCVLYVGESSTAGVVGFQAFPSDYTDLDVIWEIIFPGILVGPDVGQVDPNDIGGIDCWRFDDDSILVYITQVAKRRVEVFWIDDAFPFDDMHHFLTIHVIDRDGASGAPIDCELLPVNEDYYQSPDDPNLCVLIDNEIAPPPPPGIGGSVWIFNAMTGLFEHRIGSDVSPAVDEKPLFIDNDDLEFSVHVMQVGPVVSQFVYR